ncbi:uncharacterized protein LOC132934985 [Metopolophium dirhodum]|uniref:uncharacterized protein LOC132934985 n=1 Tax=Metopolophium dirhodum TaxID=44670 RepID=UPI0029904EEB|nr:uncharacterized protein LOC132934985 [Metopolophium dirhodum]
MSSRKRESENSINEFNTKLRQEEKKSKKNEKIGRGDCTLLKSTVTTSGLLEACHQKIMIAKDDIDNIDTVNDFSDKPNMKIPEKIITATDLNGQLEILMKWRGIEEMELIPAKKANLMWPQMIIKFYEENITWSLPSGNIKGV